MKGILSLWICVAASVATAAEVFISSSERVHLLELYTSEGCSSCPPAEQRLNMLATHEGLWSDFVPVAFHVDYWDYLGWKDRFSNAAYTARQRAYSKQRKARTIHTPCFVMNGTTTRHPTRWPRSKNIGELKAEARDHTVKVTFKPQTKTDRLVAWIAPLSGREHTQVKSGENRGRTLEHCFVALDLRQADMKWNGLVWTAELPLDRSATPRALAVWVSPRGAPQPIQATGGWLGE